MMQIRSIRGFMVVAAVLVALLLMGFSYWFVSRIYDETLREDARKVSAELADRTFRTMYQVMSRGWSRAEVEGFLASLREGYPESAYRLQLYRGPLVAALYGKIDQPVFDRAIDDLFAQGQAAQLHIPREGRYLKPLHADQRCLACHTNAREGDVLGVIEVHQDLQPMLAEGRARFMAVFLTLLPLPPLMALLVAYLIGRRLSVGLLAIREAVSKVNKVSDLVQLPFDRFNTGFREFDDIVDEVARLRDKLRGIAVDKELLEFEIKLMEGFVLTSEVVRDWRSHVKRLLSEINHFLPAYALISVFRVKDETVNLEIFWRGPTGDESQAHMEQAAREVLRGHAVLRGIEVDSIRHHTAEPDAPQMELSLEEIRLQTKSLLVDMPKIGGIIGIGLQVDLRDDPVRMLVVESILTTLLNVVGSVKAISRYTRELEYYATRDPLTNLYNQRVFWELLEYEVGRAGRHGHEFALLVIDLDNFKVINDSFGHVIGDRYLEKFAQSVHLSLRKGDIFARYGGDEFVVLLPEVEEGRPAIVAERIRDLAESMFVDTDDGQVARSSVSIGIALFPEHANTPNDLFVFADHMMYRAKSEGKNRCAVPLQGDVLDVLREASEISSLVRRALDDRLIEPYFQPIQTLCDGSVAAYEVLSRICLEDASVIPAARFVEVAEQQGLIHKMDYIVMEKAFHKASEAGYAGLLFVNISPKALLLGEFFGVVGGLLKNAHLDPQQIVFELTERETVRNLQLIEGFVKRLHLEGYKFAIDDFGSGFSSFHYVRRFPIDFIKIEGEFITNMLHDERDAALVYSMSDLARKLGIRTVAEYVESAELAQAVRGAGIDLGQGYYIGRPSPSLGEH